MKRRQFIQNVLVSTAATSVFVNLEKKAQADDFLIPSQLLYGVHAVTNKVQMFSLELTPELTPELIPQLTPQLTELIPELTPKLTTSLVNDLTATNPQLTLQPNERISSFTVLLDGTPVVATASATTSQNPNPSRLLSFSSSHTLPALQGLTQSSTIESLCATQDGRLLSIISLNQGLPPFRLATIDYLNTGEVSFINELSLPENQRFSNLAESPDGHLYATNISREGSTHIVEIFLNNGTFTTLSQLSYNGKPLSNDIQSQAYSPLFLGTTFVLANPTYQSTNSMFWVNKKTGVLNLITTFAADKIAFARS